MGALAIAAAALWLSMPCAAGPREERAAVRRMVRAGRKAQALSPDKASLSHLDPIIDKALSQEGWITFAPTEDYLGRALGTEGISLSTSVLDMPALDAAATLWHESQHVYDRAAMDDAAPGTAIMLPLEAERRGYNSGCSIWRAGRQAGMRSRSRSCDEGFDLQFYTCGHAWAAEMILWAYEHLSKDGRTVADADAEALKDPAGGDELGALLANLDPGRELPALCLEMEKGSGREGWPVSARTRKGLKDCVRDAARQVLAEGWRSSHSVCSEALQHPSYKADKTDPPVLAGKALQELGPWVRGTGP